MNNFEKTKKTISEICKLLNMSSEDIHVQICDHLSLEDGTEIASAACFVEGSDVDNTFPHHLISLHHRPLATFNDKLKYLSDIAFELYQINEYTLAFDEQMEHPRHEIFDPVNICADAFSVFLVCLCGEYTIRDAADLILSSLRRKNLGAYRKRVHVAIEFKQEFDSHDSYMDFKKNWENIWEI